MEKVRLKILSKCSEVKMSDVPIFQFAVKNSLIKDFSNICFSPTRGTEKATGWDVRSAVSIKIRPGQYAKIPLGIRMLAPEGYLVELRPRSSTFAKKQLHCLYGVIDEDYQGELIFVCQYLPDINSMGKDLKIEIGDAIGQIIPVKRLEMIVGLLTDEEYDQSTKSSRGAGGFGSTGK